ncbi:hypothetical protein WJX72_000144 [[Myrmecia] bisecta]|uniref:mitogen-activated protein kinase kinase n=1 Tax=[Myrmecia] bisecta TaxID=41462 RepID=A0AAW1QNS6_9CHLO
MGRNKPFLAPISIPVAPKPTYHLTATGVFSEGDFTISRDGLVIGDTDSPASKQCSSKGSVGSRDGTHLHQTGLHGCIEAEPSCAGSADESALYAVTLEQLVTVRMIGHGSSGLVRQVLHRPTARMVVLKVINFDVQSDPLRKQITTELRTLYGSRNPYVVKYYQSFFANGTISIVMEYMDAGSMADVLKKHQRIAEPYLAEIASQALQGLLYLHKELHVIHRDIKPSNLLLDSRGNLKIADFGVSGQLASSVSKCVSWVGTVTYMSPERLRGDSYGPDSDVWSLGLSLVEFALGRFPYPPQGQGRAGQPMGFWDLLDFIVVEEPPALPADRFSPELCDFIARCLQKDPSKRASVAELLQHPFLAQHAAQRVLPVAPRREPAAQLAAIDAALDAPLREAACLVVSPPAKYPMPTRNSVHMADADLELCAPAPSPVSTAAAAASLPRLSSELNRKAVSHAVDIVDTAAGALADPASKPTRGPDIAAADAAIASTMLSSRPNSATMRSPFSSSIQRANSGALKRRLETAQRDALGARDQDQHVLDSRSSGALDAVQPQPHGHSRRPSGDSASFQTVVCEDACGASGCRVDMHAAGCTAGSAPWHATYTAAEPAIPQWKGSLDRAHSSDGGTVAGAWSLSGLAPYPCRRLEHDDNERPRLRRALSTGLDSALGSELTSDSRMGPKRQNVVSSAPLARRGWPSPTVQTPSTSTVERQLYSADTSEGRVTCHCGLSVLFAGILFTLFEAAVLNGPLRKWLKAWFQQNRDLNKKQVDVLVNQAGVRVTADLFLLIQVPLALVVLGDKEMIRDRLYSTTRESVLLMTISGGYFLHDLLICVLRFEGVAASLHGTACCAMYIYAACSGHLHYYGAMFLMNVWGSVTSYDFWVTSSKELAQPGPHGLSATTIWLFRGANVLMNGLNTYWMSKMASGAIKLLFPSKQKLALSGQDLQLHVVDISSWQPSNLVHFHVAKKQQAKE